MNTVTEIRKITEEQKAVEQALKKKEKSLKVAYIFSFPCRYVSQFCHPIKIRFRREGRGQQYLMP